MEQIIVSLKFMKYIYPISLILLSSYQLCFSYTISVGNATYTVPEDWTTNYADASVVGVSDSSNSRAFEIGTGYAITANYITEEEYRYIQDTSGFENGSIQSSENEFAIINKLDTDMYLAMCALNSWECYFNQEAYQTITLTPISIEFLAEGAYVRTYNYVRTLTDSRIRDIFYEEIGTIGIIIDADSISYYKEVERFPDDNSLTLEETSTLYNISDSYTTSNPLTIIDKPTDSDVDGIPDVIETYLGNDPNDNSDAQASMDGIQNKYSLEEIKDLRAGSTMIEIDNGQATLSMEVEESDELGSWTISGNVSTNILLKAGEDKKFFRFKMNDSDFDLNDLTLSVGDTEYDETAIKAALAEQYDVPVESISLNVNPG